MSLAEPVSILLVDDHPDNLLSLEAVLEPLGQRMVRANSGFEALRCMLNDEFAVVLLDVQMPELDGFATARLIREREKTRHTPIVFLTAINKSHDHVIEGYTLGAVDYVFKPFEPEVLRAKVTTFVELARRTRELQIEVEQRQRAEGEVRDLNADLERRVQERTRELRKANEELQGEISERLRAELERELLLQREQSARVAAEEAVHANDELLQALRASEEQYRFLAEAIPNLVWTARPDGALDYLNQRWQEYTGRSATEIEGWQWKNVIHPEDVGPMVSTWAEILATGAVYEIEIRIRRADGAYRWHLGRAVPLRDPGGRITRWFGTCTDIHDQKQAQEALIRSEERLRFLAEASTVLSASLDSRANLARLAPLIVPRIADWCAIDLVERDGSLVRLSVAHREPELEERTWGLGRQLAASHGLAKPLREGPWLIPQLSPSSGAERLPGPCVEAIRELGLRSVITVPLVVQGEPAGLLWLGTDRGARRYGAEDLAVAEDLARRAGASLENARLFHELQEADRAKDQFLAMLGHELRNPLAPIRNAIHALRERERADPAASRLREIIDRQTQHMTRLVDDLLDVSRITSGRIELKSEAVDLNEVAVQAVETSRPAIEERRHRLVVETAPEPIWVEGDAVRLEQVVTNLLTNAAKYTEQGGEIRLLVGRSQGSESGSPAAVLRVQDTGMGIAPEMQSRVFELFAQAERSLDRSQGGLGLGLTLVRRLVRMHGGDVSAHSEGLGKGSEFVIQLPLTEPGPASAALRLPQWQSPSSAASPAGRADLPATELERPSFRRVLVVEDNVDAAETLAELLEMWGHEVRVVHDGPAAVDTALEHRPDVVLLDIGLPGMDGYEVARRLRAGRSAAPLVGAAAAAGSEKAGAARGAAPAPEATWAPFLIAITGYGQDADRSLSSAAGFDRHLTKPVDPELLRELMASAVPHPAGR
jgi:PAS domain S-box-containing protein